LENVKRAADIDSLRPTGPVLMDWDRNNASLFPIGGLEVVLVMSLVGRRLRSTYPIEVSEDELGDFVLARDW